MGFRHGSKHGNTNDGLHIGSVIDALIKHLTDKGTQHRDDQSRDDTDGKVRLHVWGRGGARFHRRLDNDKGNIRTSTCHRIGLLLQLPRQLVDDTHGLFRIGIRGIDINNGRGVAGHRRNVGAQLRWRSVKPQVVYGGLQHFIGLYKIRI